jgi:serine/threonine-protein kinase
VLLGKYRIERVLGMGGMGVVVAATHITLEERVAIKFLLPQALTNNEATTRFLREARSAVRIKSEHVARVTDVGTLETGAPYMIMEYLEGADLSHFTQRRGALPVEEAVEYVLQSCEAIAEAHALGIIHRDLKPANLFVTTRADGTPFVKVLDFGISKVSGLGASGADLSMTKTTTVMGSPLYMSPEQMASAKDVDARTDIWALGAILYELLAGRVPFQADTITQLCAMILQQSPPPLRDLRPDAPAELQAIIARSLERDRNNRYANVAEFAMALAPFAPRRARLSIERVNRVIAGAGLGTSNTNIEEAMPSSTRYGGATGAAWGASGVSKRSHGRIVGVVIGVLLALAGVAAATVWFVRSKKAPEVPADVTPPALPAEPAAAPAGSPIAVTPTPAPVAPPSATTPASASPAAPPPKPAPATKGPTKVSAVAKTPPPKPVAPAAAPAPAPAPLPAPAKKSTGLYDDRK